MSAFTAVSKTIVDRDTRLGHSLSTYIFVTQVATVVYTSLSLSVFNGLSVSVAPPMWRSLIRSALNGLYTCMKVRVTRLGSEYNNLLTTVAPLTE